MPLCSINCVQWKLDSNTNLNSNKIVRSPLGIDHIKQVVLNNVVKCNYQVNRSFIYIHE